MALFMDISPARVAFWPRALGAEYEDLSKETDPELLGQGLLRFAYRLETAGYPEDVYLLYDHIEKSSLPTAVVSRAHGDLQALRGKGEFGVRFEHSLLHFNHWLAKPQVFVGIAVGQQFLQMGMARSLSVVNRVAGWIGYPFFKIFGPYLGPPVEAFTLRLGINWYLQPSQNQERKGPLRRFESLEVPGSPRIGEVILLRQMHNFPGLEVDTYREIKSQQWQILRELERLQVKDVFVESQTQDVTPRSRFLERPAPLQLLRNVFPEGLPDQPDADQEDCLLEYGAAEIYAALHDDVTLHKTWTPEEAEANWYAMFAGTGRGLWEHDLKLRDFGAFVEMEKNRPLVFEAREALATREIWQFLRANPGKRVALIFGKAHQFADNFQEPDFRPVVRSIEWDWR